MYGLGAIGILLIKAVFRSDNVLEIFPHLTLKNLKNFLAFIPHS